MNESLYKRSQNLDHFRNRIVDVMDSCEERNLRETDLIFIKPSYEKSILEKLECTASCPICSALCWVTRDHDEDEGEGQIHRTSHQPMGLSGTRYRFSIELITDLCHDQKHVNKWWYNHVLITSIKLKKLHKYKFGFMNLYEASAISIAALVLVLLQIWLNGQQFCF
jgi:hypothetical protein